MKKMTNVDSQQYAERIHKLVQNPERISTNEELADVLKELNPGVELCLYENGTPGGTYLASAVPGEELKLPKPFYYTHKNGITNLGKQKGPVYLGISVRLMTK